MKQFHGDTPTVVVTIANGTHGSDNLGGFAARFADNVKAPSWFLSAEKRVVFGFHCKLAEQLTVLGQLPTSNRGDAQRLVFLVFTLVYSWVRTSWQLFL